jgi:hypothetical protein
MDARSLWKLLIALGAVAGTAYLLAGVLGSE